MNTLSLSSAENELTLFVGCLDPATGQSEFESYFSLFDSGSSAKLIMDFHTCKSKQCGLLFCSSVDSRDLILKQEHVLQGRVLRVSLAHSEKKGKKTGRTYPIQVSGLDPCCNIDALHETFADYWGLVSARFVQGIHPKQKKVAILTFDNPDSPRAILENTHYKIGHRSCKVAEYIQKGQTFPKLFQSSTTGEAYQTDQPNRLAQSHLSTTSHPWLLDTLAPSSPVFIPKTMASPAIGPIAASITPAKKVLSKLSLGSPFQPLSSRFQPTAIKSNYVLPVEVEEDNLFRIFCQTEHNYPRSNVLRKSETSYDTTEE